MKIRTSVTIPPGSKLTVVGPLGPINGRRMWLFNCECGREVRAPAYAVEGGGTKSCGCYARSLIGERSVTHGHSRGRKITPELQAYNSMMARCYRSKNERYPRYGGRGINVCERWRRSSEAFLDDMGPRPGPGYTLERENTDAGYSPENCRWATKAEQNRNYSRNVLVQWDGQAIPAIDVPRREGVTYGTFLKRIHRGWSPERSANETPRR